MLTGRLLSSRELEILTAVGYLVMKWNYAEHCARQILRGRLSGASIDDHDHLRLSKRNAKWIEDELRDEVLPTWCDPGKSYLHSLVTCYSNARGHRNKIVHGIQMTADANGPNGAMAFLVNTMPQGGKAPLPEFVTEAEIMPLVDHFTTLAEFSQKVLVAFDQQGGRAKNKDGTLVLAELSSPPAPLPQCAYKLFAAPSSTP